LNIEAVQDELNEAAQKWHAAFVASYCVAQVSKVFGTPPAGVPDLVIQGLDESRN
jgi:hypothetical protein